MYSIIAIIVTVHNCQIISFHSLLHNNNKSSSTNWWSVWQHSRTGTNGRSLWSLSTSSLGRSLWNNPCSCTSILIVWPALPPNRPKPPPGSLSRTSICIGATRNGSNRRSRGQPPIQILLHRRRSAHRPQFSMRLHRDNVPSPNGRTTHIHRLLQRHSYGVE